VIAVLANIVAGFLVGIVVGITGVGGGALMTPILVLLFGFAPQTAVGTDLIFAAVTKSAGWVVHGFRGTVDWQVFRRLSCGSLPAALLTVSYLYHSKSPVMKHELIVSMVGLAIVITSVGLLIKPIIHRIGLGTMNHPTAFKRLQAPLTVLAGVILGVLVSLTSIGAGALGATMLIYLYPLRMKPASLVGTDIAHAIPLALVAGAGHLAIGNVDFILLRNLLIGSVPGIILGSLISTKAPDHLVRYALATILLLVGGKMLLM
jgi:uncharacterized membrane protein YfcA